MKRAIVLSGGGAKGAYQIGVWRGLKKLGVKYDIVTGTSIGAINGLMMVQKDYLKSLWWWINIGFDLIYDDQFPNKFDTLVDMANVYKKYLEHFFKEGGVSTHKMTNLINRVFNWNKFRKSPIDYGLITVNLTKFESLNIRKKDLKKDQVVKYVMASACCYPAFKKLEINGEKYIDGGYYDNMPINLAIEMGAEEVIAVDLEAFGFKKSIKDHKVKVIYIKPRNDIGSFLVFDKKLAIRAIRFGYYDTMKEFHKLDGNKYTFKHNQLNSNYIKYNKKFLNIFDTIFYTKKSGLYDNLLKLIPFSKILKTKQEHEIKKTINETIEFLGNTFGIDECYIYDISKFNRILIKKNKIKEEISLEFIQKSIKNKDFKKLFNTSSIVKYLYNLLQGENNQTELSTLALIFHKELIAAVYLKTIK